MPEMDVDHVPEGHEDNGAEGGRGGELKRKSDGKEGREGEATLAAWKRCTQGPLALLMRSEKNRGQAEEWAIQLMEEMAEEGVPDGAVPALVKRAAMDLEMEQAIEAPAVYRERRQLRPDFVQGVSYHM